MAELRTYVWANNVTDSLELAIDEYDTLISVSSDGSLFPLPDPGNEIFTLVLSDRVAGKYEILNVTERVGDNFTVERGAEGTSIYSWPAGTVVRHSATAGWIQKMVEEGMSSILLTSRPYPYVFVEAIELAFTIPYDPKFTGNLEAVESGFSILSGELELPLVPYTDGEPEAVESSFAIVSGELDLPLVTYTDGEPEAVESSFAIQSGVLDQVLLSYTDGEPEAVESSFSIQSGSLT